MATTEYICINKYSRDGSYRVCFMWRGQQYTKSFLPKKHKNPLIAAKRWRDAKWKELGRPLIEASIKSCDFSHNRVYPDKGYIHWCKNPKRPNEPLYIRVFYRNAGARKCAYFRVDKFSSVEEAKRHALEFRNNKKRQHEDWKKTHSTEMRFKKILKPKPKFLTFDTGLLVKQMIEDSGLTTKDIASRSGVTRQCLSTIIKGKVSPNFSTLELISEACGFALIVGYSTKLERLEGKCEK